jgi:hypothetical protein
VNEPDSQHVAPIEPLLLDDLKIYAKDPSEDPWRVMFVRADVYICLRRDEIDAVVEFLIKAANR